MRIRSFDIFDTLVTRRVARPVDLFLCLGEQLEQEKNIQVTPQAFAHTRAKAERDARQKVPNGEVNFDEIYAQLSSVLGLAPEIAATIQQRELRLEEAMLCAIPGMAEKVRRARQEAEQIIFISDMYLPVDFLESILQREGYFQAGDRLYVSHQWRASKRSGKLFQIIRDDLRTEIKDWLHCGDCPEADVAVPRQCGLRAEGFASARLSPYESIARGDEQVCCARRSRYAGAMRLARLRNTEQIAERAVIWDSGANIVGPLLFGFVVWCLEQATKLNIPRLYFVARDGQILHRLAQVITQAWGYDVQCHYLYGSRQAWHVPSFAQITKERIAWLIQHARFLFVEQFFAMFSLQANRFEAELEAAGFPRTCWLNNLGPEERERVTQLLLQGEVLAAAETQARANRELAMLYLQQEGFFASPTRAMVDIGWNGNMQNSLAGIISLSGKAKESELTGFYFGLRPQRTCLPGQKYFGYWNEFGHPQFPIWRENLSFFEIFTSADHGSTLGYQKTGERIEPLLSSPNNELAMQWGLLALQESIVEFARQATQNFGRNAFAAGELFQLGRELYHEFYHHPDQVLAKTWGGFKFSNQQAEQTFEQPVPTLSYGQLLAAIWDYRRRPEWWWPDGSLALQRCAPLRLMLTLKRLKHRMADRSFFEKNPNT